MMTFRSPARPAALAPVFLAAGLALAAWPALGEEVPAAAPTGVPASEQANDEGPGDGAAGTDSPQPSAPPLATTSAGALADPLAQAPLPGARRSEVDERAARIVDRLLGEMSQAEGEVMRMSLVEAVRAAVANNPGIRAQAELPNAAAWAPFGASGAFDPVLRGDSTGSRVKAPTGSALAAGGLTTFEEDAIRSGASISKLMRSGATLGVDWTSDVVDTNATFFSINSRYDNRLAISLRQPLLRNIFASNETTAVLVADAEADESLAAFEARTADFVAGVIDAYWAQIQAAANLEVNRRSIILATELVRDAEAKVAVGLLAPVAVKEALADQAAREQRGLVAENDLTIAGRNLQYQVMLGSLDEKQPARVQAVEDHVVTQVELDRATSLRTAVENRPEIRGATVALGRARLEEKRAKNQRLPNLDLVAQYGMLGLSGDRRPCRPGQDAASGCFDNGTPGDPSDDYQGSPYLGDYSDSLNDMIGNDFNQYSVGLQFEVPFGNAAARAAYAQAAIDVRRASRDLEQSISNVALEVDTALAEVASAAKRVVASKAARELAEENLRNQTRRFELGAVTTKDVLDYQEQLALQQASEIRAITDHARAVAQLRRAEGTLLVRFGIEIQRPDAPGKPWWFAF